MIEIIPAILANSYDDLYDDLNLVAGRVPIVHIDVADGTLTPNTTWPYSGETEEFEKIKNEEEGLPFWEDVGFEVHLMVQDPESTIDDWIKAGAERIIVHVESFDSSDDLSNFLVSRRKDLDQDSYLGIQMGLAINIDTNIERIMPHVLDADFIHLMSINKIGGQGKEFQPEIFDRIKELKHIYPETILSIDGGVKLENAEDIIDHGVERLVIGSSIFGSSHALYALEDFLAIKKKHDSHRR
jgi:ribulose-phosphate 3-epimerase